MKRIERVFNYARDRMALSFEAFAERYPGLVLYYTLTVPKPGLRPGSTKELDSGTHEVSTTTLKALRSEAFRTRVVKIAPGMAPLVLGRDDQVELALPDDEATSTRHAEILWASDQPTISDLGSKNGTKVNGERIDAPRSLREGDVLVIGTTVIHVFGTRGFYDMLSTLLDPHIALPS